MTLLKDQETRPADDGDAQTVVIGAIGCGARVRHLGALLRRVANPNARFAYVCDPSESSVSQAIEMLGRPRVVTDYRQMLEDRSVSWVMIGSPNHLHAEHAIAALRAGKHVFCEKPLATTIEDCLAIRDALRQTDRQFVFGFTLRYSPLYREIHRIVSSGKLGKVVSLEFNETLSFNHGAYIMGDWRRLTSLSGGHLLEKCCHDIDIVNWIVDSRVVRAATFGGLSFFTPQNSSHIERLGTDEHGHEAYRTFDGARIPRDPFTTDKDIVDNQVAIFEYANGVRATFHTNCNSALPERRIAICGTEGTLRADVREGVIEYRRIGFHEKTHNIDMNDSSGMHGGGDEVMIRELDQCMRLGTPPATPLETGLVAAVTCLATDQSLRSGNVIDLTPYWKRVFGQ